ncbi:hypothetical protein BDV59DRAFT_207517 [Aspergillus ambiguus]|uniref:TauD/TfdA dioxygenase family protein n=1 Tax=Aspergillus ambiguus TaxID=176160 RepID=UPI003CCE1B0B
MTLSAETTVQSASTPPASHYIREPLKDTGSLDAYKRFDVTPVIGLELPDVQVTDMLEDDIKLRDLAITVSRRGVVFFRNQNITPDQQKVLAQKLGELTGKPATSKLYRHAVYNSRRNIAPDDKGNLDDEVSVISSEVDRKYYGYRFMNRIASEGWHSDATLGKFPADYSILKMTHLPDGESGGDTLWASGYEVYDRLSSPIQKLVEGLTAVHQNPHLNYLAKTHEMELEEDRGAPEDTVLAFKAKHPVVRTNPVTGWKCLFGAVGNVENGFIEGVTKRESDILKRYFHQLIAENHDLQVRFKWGQDDLAIWDNRCVFHTATYYSDYTGKRQGNRVASLGEAPYLDPASKSRAEALAGR